MTEVQTKKMHPVEIGLSQEEKGCIEISQTFNGETQSVILTVEQLPHITQWLNDISHNLLNKKGSVQ